jgi:hypothetical protein
VVGVAIAELIELLGGYVECDHGRIIDMLAGIHDLDKWTVITVANRPGLKLLGWKEIRCIARRRAALWPEIDFACLEGELEFRPEGRFAHATTDVRKCQLRRVIESQRSGVSSVVRIGHDIPDCLAALHYSVIKGQGDGALGGAGSISSVSAAKLDSEMQRAKLPTSIRVLTLPILIPLPLKRLRH